MKKIFFALIATVLLSYGLMACSASREYCWKFTYVYVNDEGYKEGFVVYYWLTQEEMEIEKFMMESQNGIYNVQVTKSKDYDFPYACENANNKYY